MAYPKLDIPLDLAQPATHDERRAWFEQRVQSDITLDHAVKWLDSLNLHYTNYTIALAEQLRNQGDIAGSLELLRTFICSNLKAQNFKAVMVGLDNFHALCLKTGQSPRDLFIDDYLDLFLPKLGTPEKPERRKNANDVKIGYLVPLALDSKSTIPPVAAELACQHAEAFNAHVLVPFTRDEVLRSNPKLIDITERLIAPEKIVYHHTEFNNEWDRVEAFAKFIESLQLDTLITMLAIFADSAIGFMRPAPQVLAIDLGNPHWYSHKYIDKVFSTHPHFHFEAQTESHYAPLGFTRKRSMEDSGQDDSDGKVIEFVEKGSLVLFSSGSPDRFASDDMWSICNFILAEEDVNWIFLGPEPAMVLNRVDSRFHNRIATFPRSPNFSWFLKQADLYVDTFPIGGGYSLLEAFDAGIPCALFRHEVNRPFNKSLNFAPYSHISPEPSFASQARKDAFREQVKKLVRSPEAREQQVQQQKGAVGVVNCSDALIRKIEGTVTPFGDQTNE